MNQKWKDKYLQKVIISLPDKEGKYNDITIEDVLRGISILGATGSGKTSGSGRTIALKFLNEGWGGVVFTVKQDEVTTWQQYFKDARRKDELIVFGEDSVTEDGKLMVFNPLDYELVREGTGGGQVQNVVNIFMNIYRMGNRIAQEGDISKEERFWDSALKRFITMTIELLKLAQVPLTFDNIYKIALSCSSKDSNNPCINSTSINFWRQVRQGKKKGDINDPNITNEEKDELMQYAQDKFFASMCLATANHATAELQQATSEFQSKAKTDADYNRRLYHQVKDYFTEFLLTMAEKTKSTIVEMFIGLAQPFLSGILYKHFSGKTTLKPDLAFEGKVLIINFPVRQYLDVGLIAQSVFKLLYQQAVERRKIYENTKPVFLWCDEAHIFVNPYDQLFLTTARSSLCSTVYLTQSISNYYAVMGSGSDSESKVDSLMGNLTTKIFHANSDAKTNEYASRLIGNSLAKLKNVSVSSPLYDLNVQTSEGNSQQFLPQVQPRQFSMLRTGGISPENDGTVDAIVFSMGKDWTTQTNYLETFFNQNFKL